MPLVSLTRATLRRAEFGFLGVVVYTRVQTPRLCGAATFFFRPLPDLRPGVASLRLGATLPLRINWLVVGMRCARVAGEKIKSAMPRFSLTAVRLGPPVRRRRPPFALVLVVIAAALGGGLLLIGGGVGSGTGAGSASPPPTFVGSGPTRVCVTGHAQFEASRRATVRIPVEATAPVSATARATVGRVTVTATLSKRIVEHATVTRRLVARQAAIATRRVCVRAATAHAAHTAALNKAYRSALAAARAAAGKQAA